MHYNRMLLSIDCSGDEKEAVDEAFRLKSIFQSSLSVLAINDPGAGKAHMMMDTLPRVTHDDIVSELRNFGYGGQIDEVEIITLDSESYAAAIAQASKDFDLLIMGHHPKNRVLAMLKDSTDEQVADRIDCPMLLVPLKAK